MTLDEAKGLRYGDIIHEDDCVLNVGPRGGVSTRVTEWRVNGRPRTWKRDPWRVEIPAKHGMYESFTFTQGHLGSLHLPQDCPLAGLDTYHASSLESV